MYSGLNIIYTLWLLFDWSFRL